MAFLYHLCREIKVIHPPVHGLYPQEAREKSIITTALAPRLSQWIIRSQSFPSHYKSAADDSREPFKSLLLKDRASRFVEFRARRD